MLLRATKQEKILFRLCKVGEGELDESCSMYSCSHFFLGGGAEKSSCLVSETRRAMTISLSYFF